MAAGRTADLDPGPGTGPRTGRGTGSGAELRRAVAALRRGGLVGMPTETVYGLAADADDADAIRRIFAAKGRPADHPLIVHIGGAAQLDDWAVDVPAAARALAEALWPGPLTLLLARGPRVLDVVTGGLPTVGLRVPAHPVALRLLRDFGGGLAAPSANRFGRVSPTSAADVRSELGDAVDVVLDGGPATIGVESTIVDLSSGDPVVLRPGGVPRERLAELLGVAVPVAGPQAPARASGMLAAHYAPTAAVVLVDGPPATSGVATGLLAPAGVPTPAGMLRVASPESADDYARQLYAALRAADRAGLRVLYAVPPQPRGLGLAVRDRLRRAAVGSGGGDHTVRDP